MDCHHLLRHIVMKSDELFAIAEKLQLLEQAGGELSPVFAEAVDGLADDLIAGLNLTLARWRRTLIRAVEEPHSGSRLDSVHGSVL